MSDKKECNCKAKIEQLEADLAFYKKFADTVRKKSRAFPAVGDALFAVVRQYQRQLKVEKSR